MKNEKYRIVYEFDGKSLTIGGGAEGEPAVMPAIVMAQIAAEALNALLTSAKPDCHCQTCELFRLTRDQLRAVTGMVRKFGGEPSVLRAQSFKREK